MMLLAHRAARRVSGSGPLPLLLILAAAMPLSAGAHAQSQPSEKPAEARAADLPRGPEIVQTLYLTSATQQRDLDDAQTDLRNMLPRAKIYGIAAQNAITIRGTEEEIQTAQKILAEVDRPRKVYRLTFTITELDQGRSVGTQRLSMIAIAGERSEIRQGNKVPIAVGSRSRDNTESVPETQYLDIGLLVDATVEGGTLHTKVEQSAISDEKSGIGAQDPVIHQTVLNDASALSLGKPVLLGSLDIPGTTRRQQVEVTAETVQ